MDNETLDKKFVIRANQPHLSTWDIVTRDSDGEERSLQYEFPSADLARRLANYLNSGVRQDG